MTFGNWDNKNINENEENNPAVNVLASLCCLPVWVLTSIKLISPFEDFLPFYKSGFASLKKVLLSK